MALSLLYCPACGAANAPGDSACFACQQPLAIYSAEDGQTSLLHGRYQMLGQLGTGGFGAVYKALDIQDQNRHVAIKQINLRGLTPQEVIEATDGFNREVQMLSTLSDSHLPRIYAHFTDPEHWYIVMDFIAGETLEHYVRDITSAHESAIRVLVLDEVLDIALQVCSVLTYLHAHQPPIIFRDLKPANIMRTPRGRLYLIDFGIARYFKPGQSRDTIPLGSPGYASPEQYGRAQTTIRADIYSLGALLHHLLSRHDPSETPFVFAPLHLAAASGTSELETLIARMVEQDVERRPSDIGEVESSLTRIREQRVSEPRIWRPVAPGQSVPPPVLARGAYQSPQVQQQIKQQLTARKKSRRKFLIGSLAVASTLALGGSIGGFAGWRYWHPTLTLEQGFPRTLASSNGDISAIAWSSDGQQVAFGLSSGTILANRLPTTNGSVSLPIFFAFAIDLQAIKVLAWSPDNRQLVAAAEFGQPQLWDTNLSKSWTLNVGEGGILAAAWSSDGNILAVSDVQGKAYLYNVQAGTTLQLTSLEGALFIGSLTWSPDGTHLVTEMSTPSANNVLQIWDIITGQSFQMSTSIPLNSLESRTLVWSPDGQNIALLGIDGTVEAWNISNTYSQVFSQQIGTQSNQLAWSPDNRFLATIDSADNLLLLDRSNGNTLTSAAMIDPLGRGAVFPGQALTWLPDSQHIAVVNSNAQYWLWSLS